ncbi:hypothetical protein HMPREF3225_01696, partial [Staphylococcus lugdunensis]
YTKVPYFLKYVDVKLYINTKYSIKKKQSDELNSIHLTAIF